MCGYIQNRFRCGHTSPAQVSYGRDAVRIDDQRVQVCHRWSPRLPPRVTDIPGRCCHYTCCEQSKMKARNQCHALAPDPRSIQTRQGLQAWHASRQKADLEQAMNRLRGILLAHRQCEVNRCILQGEPIPENLRGDPDPVTSYLHVDGYSVGRCGPSHLCEYIQ